VTPEAALLSFRLGDTDGVSVEAGKWEQALRELGFSVRRVAGELGSERDDDTLLPWLAITADPGAADPDALARALAGADLVVAENVCSLPLNLGAARAAARALARHPGRIVLHHHDLPWQRSDLVGVLDFPPDLPGALHVTINERSRTELAARGIEAVTVHNRFDFDAPAGDRDGTRRRFDFAPTDLVLLQPTRAIPRKNIGAGLAFAAALAPLVPERDVRYWRTGAVEDGYADELRRLEAAATVELRHGRTNRRADAYAAADVVVFPSTWEGFGNPVIESVVARRPLVVGSYPVLDEITACGLRFFALDAPGTLADWLRAPDPAILEENRRRARAHYDLADLAGELDAAFRSHGWTTW
jgi:glycosyltransferase involved in cell wall biosynthesis